MIEDPSLPRHHLTIRLHSAQLETPAPLLERHQQQLVCVAEIERFGRLRMEAYASSSEEATCWQFEFEEVCRMPVCDLCKPGRMLLNA